MFLPGEGVAGLVLQRWNGGRDGEGRRPRYKPCLRWSPGLGFPSGDERAAVGGACHRTLEQSEQRALRHSIASPTAWQAAIAKGELGSQGEPHPPFTAANVQLGRCPAVRYQRRDAAWLCIGIVLDQELFPFRIRSSVSTTAEWSWSGSCRGHEVLPMAAVGPVGSGRSDPPAAARRVESQTAQHGARAKCESRPGTTDAVRARRAHAGESARNQEVSGSSPSPVR